MVLPNLQTVETREAGRHFQFSSIKWATRPPPPKTTAGLERFAQFNLSIG